jgi:hypothetical protein
MLNLYTLNQVLDILCENEGIAIQREEIGEKVIKLRELQPAIIYTSTISKQAVEGRVSTAFIA